MSDVAIIVIRGERVILDSQLAALYGTTTRRLNEQVKRNHDRFPADFLIRLSELEARELMRSQFATASLAKRNRRFLPYAFTEHGALMAATLLNTDRAIAMSVYVVRAFIELRRQLLSNTSLQRKLEEIELKLGRRLMSHEKAIREIFNILQALKAPPEKRKRGIGFTADV